MNIIEEQHKALVAAGRHAEAEAIHRQLGRLIDVMHSIRQTPAHRERIAARHLPPYPD